MATPTATNRRYMIVPKEQVKPVSDQWFMAAGRVSKSGINSARQRAYYCDQRDQGCKATIRWLKQVTGSWKLTFMDGTHENCGGSSTNASLAAVTGVIEGIVKNDSSMSGPKLRAAAQAASGANLSLRSVQRAKQQLTEPTAAEKSALMSKLRPYFRELQHTHREPSLMWSKRDGSDGHAERAHALTHCGGVRRDAVCSAIAGSCSSREELLHQHATEEFGAAMKAIHDNPITLANLAEVRSSGDTGPLAPSNRLFSLDESVQELAAVRDAGGELVVDCSTVPDGRNPSGLAEISRRSGLSVVMAASWKETDRKTLMPSPETIGKELKHQLLFGEHGHSPTSTAQSAGAPARIQAGILVVKIDDSFNPATPVTKALEGAAIAHRATGAPLMLALSHFIRWKTLEEALATVSSASPTNNDAGDVTPARSGVVMVAGMHGGVSQSLQDQTELLRKGLVLCFDCFGRVEWSPGPDYYPSDEETAVRIAKLALQGFSERIVLSSGVSRRIHLSRFGGHGYGHALRTLPPRLLRLGVSTDEIALMTKGNMLRLLDWYTPPPPPVETPKDYLPCSWCKKRFEPVEGEYFHKFRFVYCGIKCLRGHRDTGFDEEAAASRSA